VSNAEGQAWHGPRPLNNRLDVARLSEIYSRTAAFYDGVVAEKQAGAKRAAIELLARRPGERFLEIGVGTAWAFQRIIAASGPAHAAGLDVAAGMLEVAKGVLAAAGTSCPSLLLGDGRALPFPNCNLDCILNTYTFEVMSLPDIAAMLAEMRRVLRPGGRAVIVNLTDATDGGAEEEAMLRDWKARYQADPESFGGARPLQLTAMLRATGFEVGVRRYVGPDWPSEVLLARKEQRTGNKEQESDGARGE
jgi:ubiquinone/menaquinone biosynthesis C-methylase UbiE